jgi:flagellar basal-body rod protein FlgC
MSMFTGFRILSSGMSAQRTRLNVISSNLANAQTTRSEDGGAYRRKDPVFAATPLDGIAGDDPTNGELVGVEVIDIAMDDTPLPMVFDPSHPDADENGYVEMPNVNVVEEMVEMVTASRSFEANATAFQTLRDMMARAIDLGK